MRNLLHVIFATILVTATILNAQSNIPNGWFAAGNNNSEYDIGIDNTTVQNGKSSIFIKSKSPEQNNFGNLMQTISAENYLGKRLKLSGFVKTEKVDGWSGLWMRIDGENNEQLGFDNMRNRSIKGTTEWKNCAIVLDIPENSKSINYGILLGGEGKVWIDNIKIEEVDRSVAVTNLSTVNKLPKYPINLDFEEK